MQLESGMRPKETFGKHASEGYRPRMESQSKAKVTRTVKQGYQ